MKKFAIVFAALLITATAFSQKSTETRTPGSFNGVSIAGGFKKLILKEGSKESIELQSDGADLSEVETKVKNNGLGINLKEKSKADAGKITLIVTYNSLKSLNASGSTPIETDGTLKAEKFTYNASGSGSMTGNFDVRDLELNVAGSAASKLTGKADKQHFAVSGSGDIDAGNLKGENADVAVAGSGSVAVNVSGKVKSSVAGSGSVTNKNKSSEK